MSLQIRKELLQWTAEAIIYLIWSSWHQGLLTICKIREM